MSRPPPEGPAPELRKLVARLRRRLQRLPARHRRRPHPRPALPRRRLGAPDHRARRLPALSPARQPGELRASRSTGIGGAAPVARAAAGRGRRAARRRSPSTRSPTGEAAGLLPARQRLERDRARQRGDRNGAGMVLGNPHFPWDGAERLYQAQLTIPGKLDVSGGSLYGVPAVLIGQNRHLAWSHTVASAWRFTPFELTLVPAIRTPTWSTAQPTADEAGRAHGQGADRDGGARGRGRGRSTRPSTGRWSPRPRPAAVPVDAGYAATRSATSTTRTSATSTTSSRPTGRGRCARTTGSSARSRASRG